MKLNQKLSLCNMKFCVETWEKMQQKTKTQLTDTALVYSFIRTICRIKK